MSYPERFVSGVPSVFSVGGVQLRLTALLAVGGFTVVAACDAVAVLADPELPPASPFGVRHAFPELCDPWPASRARPSSEIARSLQPQRGCFFTRLPARAARFSRTVSGPPRQPRCRRLRAVRPEVLRRPPFGGLCFCARRVRVCCAASRVRVGTLPDQVQRLCQQRSGLESGIEVTWA